MPEADLAFVFDCCFHDLGSYYALTNEVTEVVYWLYELIVGRLFSDRAWIRSVERASCTLPVDEPGCNLGSASGAQKAPSGFQVVDNYIQASTQLKTQKHFSAEGGQWMGQDGCLHGDRELMGVGGGLPPLGQDP